MTGPITLISLFLVSRFIYFFVYPYARLSWLYVVFLLHVKYTLSYRIVWTRQKWYRTTPPVKRQRQYLRALCVHNVELQTRPRVNWHWHQTSTLNHESVSNLPDHSNNNDNNDTLTIFMAPSSWPIVARTVITIQAFITRAQVHRDNCQTSPGLLDKFKPPTDFSRETICNAARVYTHHRHHRYFITQPKSCYLHHRRIWRVKF